MINPFEVARAVQILRTKHNIGEPSSDERERRRKANKAARASRQRNRRKK